MEKIVGIKFKYHICNIYMTIVSQMEGLRDTNTIISTGGDYPSMSIRSSGQPELRDTRLYIRGRGIERDNMIAEYHARIPEQITLLNRMCMLDDKDILIQLYK